MRDFDINIHLRDGQIVYACFYPWEGLNDYSGDEMDEIIIENKPMEEQRWKEIEQSILKIVPILKRKEKPKESRLKNWLLHFLRKKIQVLDGGDASGFALTWREENGEEFTVDYVPAHIPEFYFILELMRETVHPIGRKLDRIK